MFITNCSKACKKCVYCQENQPTIECMEFCNKCSNYISPKYDYLQYMYTQEMKICIYFLTNADECTNCKWRLDFYLFRIDNWNTMTFDTDQPLKIINSWTNSSAVTFTSNSTLYMSMAMDKWNYQEYGTEKNNFYIYESNDLTNYITTEIYGEYMGKLNWFDYTSPSGNFTIFYVGSLWKNYTGYVSSYFTNDETSSNCNDTNLYFIEEFMDVSISTNGTGPCILYIIVSRGTTDATYNIVPTLNIKYISYTGNASVIVCAGYNFTYELFKFDQSTGVDWAPQILYGSLISLLIPPGGELDIGFETFDFSYVTTNSFGETGLGLAMSPWYPYYRPLGDSLCGANTYLKTVLTSSEWFSLNLTIVYADIPLDTNLSIACGNNIHIYTNQTIRNLCIHVWDCNELDIKFDVSNLTLMDTTKNDNPWGGYLIEYVAVNTPYPSTSRKRFIWIACASVAAFIVVIILMGLAFYMYTRKQKKNFVQLYRDMSLTPEDLEVLKRSTDEFLIDNKKLDIDFTNPIGNGSTSNVYKAKLHGPSSLHLLMKMMETQRFCDCEVAVKMASDFGQNEAENLFKEIQAMKQLGYHEHIISMLGWCKHNEKPCLVFELAQTDLLKHVRSFSDSKNSVSVRRLLSILWQVADGMQYITSKGLIHRDLAARNILLCDNYASKISDFGLCCRCGDTYTYQASLLKKLPMKWLSIEAIQTRTFSEKSDVWSFGILMYEVFSFGKIPYETMNNNADMLEYRSTLYLLEGRRLEQPELANENMYDLMKSCWQEDPQNRPVFNEIVPRLRIMIERLTEEYGYLP